MANSDEDESWQDEPDDEEDDGYVPCPHCGGLMLEAADYCPECRRWITSEDVSQRQRRQQPMWIVVVVLILLATIVLSIFPP